MAGKTIKDKIENAEKNMQEIQEKCRVSEEEFKKKIEALEAEFKKQKDSLNAKKKERAKEIRNLKAKEEHQILEEIGAVIKESGITYVEFLEALQTKNLYSIQERFEEIATAEKESEEEPVDTSVPEETDSSFA